MATAGSTFVTSGTPTAASGDKKISLMFNPKYINRATIKRVHKRWLSSLSPSVS